jgi:hypothetical protein
MSSPRLVLAKRSTILIPSATIFSVISLDDYFETFFAGRSVTHVAIPLIESAGFHFSYSIDGVSRAAQTVLEERNIDTRSITINDIIEFFVGKNLKIVLTLELSLPQLSMTSGACDLTNVAGRSSAHCCLNNPITQRYIRLLLQQSLPAIRDSIGDRLTGVAVIIANLWPMSAQTGRFLLTCFCPHCVAKLTELKPDFSLEWFKEFPNAANLALVDHIQQVDGIGDIGGIFHVDDLHFEMEEKKVLDACSQVKGTYPANSYDKGSWQHDRVIFKRWAHYLKTYLQAKSLLTIDAIGRVFESIAEVCPGIARIIIGEYPGYSWNSGLFDEQMTKKLADEIWIPITPRTPPTDTMVRPLLARRGLYYVINFFDFVDTIKSEQLRSMVRDMRRKRVEYLLASRSEEVLSEVQSGDSVLPEKLANQPESVAVGLNADIVNRIVSHLSESLESFV